MLVALALAKQIAVSQPSLVKDCFSSVHYLLKDTALFLNLHKIFFVTSVTL